MEVKARNREVLDQSCRGERETVEHFLVECAKYKKERDRLIGSITVIIGEDEWNRRLEQEDGEVLTVNGLY